MWGGSFSIADLMAVLYFDVLHLDPRQPDMPERDRFFFPRAMQPQYYIPHWPEGDSSP